MPRVVLDARAGAGLAKHLEVEVGALPQALRLEQPAGVFELFHAVHKLDLDVLDRLEELLARRDEVPRRVDVHLVSLREHLAGERVELRDPLDVVAEKLDAHGKLFVRGLDLEGVAADAELAAHQIGVGALVLDVDEMPKDRVAANALALVQADRHSTVVDRGAKTVDAGDRRDDDHVSSLEQRPRRGAPQAGHLRDPTAKRAGREPSRLAYRVELEASRRGAWVPHSRTGVLLLNRRPQTLPLSRINTRLSPVQM